MTTGVYAADGSMNITVVSGSSVTGLYAIDGSVNVVSATGLTYCGAYHPCGALWITYVTSGVVGHYAADGSLYVTDTPYTPTGATRVTVISGSLGGSFFLLRNGVDNLLLRNSTDKIILGYL